MHDKQTMKPFTQTYMRAALLTAEEEYNEEITIISIRFCIIKDIIDLIKHNKCTH